MTGRSLGILLSTLLVAACVTPERALEIEDTLPLPAVTLLPFTIEPHPGRR